MNEFTPITQRKAITMDYEEYLKYVKIEKLLHDAIADIINTNIINDIKAKYIDIADKLNKGEI